MKNSKKIAIIVSTFYKEINKTLLDSAYSILIKNGISKNKLDILYVPGSFELPFACSHIARLKKYHAILTIGCVIKGETENFKYISNAIAKGIMKVSLDFNIPIIYGVLTTYNKKEAWIRVNPLKKNKGKELAKALIGILNFTKY